MNGFVNSSKNSHRRRINFRRYRRRGPYNFISRVAKRTILKTAETKITQTYFDINVNDRADQIFEIPFAFDLGAQKYNAIGSKVKYRNLNFKMYVRTQRNAATQLNLVVPICFVRCTLVQFRQVITSTNQVVYDSTAGFTNFRVFERLNPNSVRVLKDIILPLSPAWTTDNEKDDAVPSAAVLDYNFKVNNDVNIDNVTRKPTDPVDRYGIYLTLFCPGNTGENTFIKAFAYGVASLSFVDI